MSAVELDKSFNNVVASYGTLQIRVVVLKPSVSEDDSNDEGKPAAPEDDEPVLEHGATPLSAYLEKKSYGKHCVVFLLNGQRHDAWDNTFIVRQLGFRYLRTRTMIIVDLDGLTNEAISDIMQGSRQGLYPGAVLAAITDRMVATLKKDPDMVRLQTEAEQEVSELQAGDEVVRQRLDELIDAHHSGATHTNVGINEAGATRSTDPVTFGKDKRQVVVENASPTVGVASVPPVLVSLPPNDTFRMRANAWRQLAIRAQPEGSWSNVDTFEWRIEPQLDDVRHSVEQVDGGVNIRLQFEEPDGFDEDDYPIDVTLSAFAKFKGFEELRMLKRRIVINGEPRKLTEEQRKKREEARKRNAIPLKLTPTFLRVLTRQPVSLVPGGPSAHVRIRWDGEDALTSGSSPPWKFTARCLSLGTFPAIGFSEPRGGKFELVLDTPHGLLAKQTLDFEVEAVGPSGQRLAARFGGEIAEVPPEPEPRKLKTSAPEAEAQRRPPYELKYVFEPEWETSATCWSETSWTKDDAASFADPTGTTPLTLIVNSDFGALKEFRDALVKRNLDETTVKERVTRYTTHVAFHLYQMHNSVKALREAQAADEDVRVPTDEELAAEIRRVATTLLKLMEVAFR